MRVARIAVLLASVPWVGCAVAQTPAPAADPRPPGPARMTDEQPRPPGPSKSARFRLQVGRIGLGMTCPDDEPMKACADVALQLLDKAQSMMR